MVSALEGLINTIERTFPFTAALQLDIMTPSFVEGGGVMIEHQALGKSFASSL
jgi:hypothetical protein